MTYLLMNMHHKNHYQSYSICKSLLSAFVLVFIQTIRELCFQRKQFPKVITKDQKSK